MRTEVTKEMVKNAETIADNDLATAAKGAIEDGVVVGSLLRLHLEKAGFAINTKPGDKHGVWLTVTKDGAVVAQAFADTESEALRQAVAAELRTAAKAETKAVQ